MNTSNIHPTGHMVVVKVDTTPEKTAGGIILPDAKRERDTLASNTGVMVEAAPAAFDHVDWPEGTAAPPPGSRVLIARHAGVEHKANDGFLYRVCEDKAILAVMEC